MSNLVESLKQQIAHTYHERQVDAKRHEEEADKAQAEAKRHRAEADKARYDAQQCALMLSVFQVTADGIDPGTEGSVPPEDDAPLQVSHRIDVGELAAHRPRENPFRDRPDSPAFHVWDIMHAGKTWHVRKELMPALKAAGHPIAESTIYSALTRHKTVFEGSDGFYAVTSDYRSPMGTPTS